MNKLKGFFHKFYNEDLLRPIIYKSFARFVYGLTIALIWNKLVNISGFVTARGFAFPIIGVFFLVLAWFCYLRLDGVNVPRIFKDRSKKKRSKIYGYGDIVDYADQHIVSFEELNEDQRELCILIADLVCGVLFLLIALI